MKEHIAAILKKYLPINESNVDEVAEAIFKITDLSPRSQGKDDGTQTENTDFEVGESKIGEGGRIA